MGWFPYPSASGADQFYAFYHPAGNDPEDWQWCFNRTPRTLLRPLVASGDCRPHFRWDLRQW